MLAMKVNLGLFSPINSLSTPLTLLSLISRLAFFLVLKLLNHPDFRSVFYGEQKSINCFPHTVVY